jgi:hypothetical protein
MDGLRSSSWGTVSRDFLSPCVAFVVIIATAIIVGQVVPVVLSLLAGIMLAILVSGWRSR